MLQWARPPGQRPASAVESSLVDTASPSDSQNEPEGICVRNVGWLCEFLEAVCKMPRGDTRCPAAIGQRRATFPKFNSLFKQEQTSAETLRRSSGSRLEEAAHQRYGRPAAASCPGRVTVTWSLRSCLTGANRKSE